MPGNEEATAAAVGGLVSMLQEFDEKNTDTEINEHITRINGYVYALVNVGILDEEQANGSLRKSCPYDSDRRYHKYTSKQGYWSQ